MADRLALSNGSDLLLLVDGASHLLLAGAPSPASASPAVIELTGASASASSPATASSAVIELTGASASVPTDFATVEPAVIELVGVEVTVPITAKASDEWHAKLVDQNGTVLACIPRPMLGTISETLNEPTTATATVVRHSNRQAARQLALAYEGVTPAWEVQIWRGKVCRFWGPIVSLDMTEDGSAWELQMVDAIWLLTRRIIGRRGYNYAGYHGDPNPTADYLQNPQFRSGYTEHLVNPGDVPPALTWSIMKTDGGTVVTPTAGIVTTSSADPPAPGAAVLEWNTPVAASEIYSLFQDIVVQTLADPLRLRASVYVRIPAAATFTYGGFFNAGITLSYVPYPVTDPVQYLSPLGLQASPIAPTIARDQWVLLESPELEVPPNTNAILHVAIVLPQGQGQLSIPDGPLYDDGGMGAVDFDPVDIVAALAYQAQRIDLDKPPVNITVDGTATGQKVTRVYSYANHPSAGDSIMALAGDGYLDWWTDYRGNARVICSKARRGQYRPECRLSERTVTNVRATAAWNSGATAVAVQSQGERGRHEYPDRIPDVLCLEDVSVASRETTPADLTNRAAKRLDSVSKPKTLQFTGRPGSTITTALRAGDWTDSMVDMDGVTLTGTYRVARLDVDPMTDRATGTANPYTPA